MSAGKEGLEHDYAASSGPGKPSCAAAAGGVDMARHDGWASLCVPLFAPPLFTYVVVIFSLPSFAFSLASSLAILCRQVCSRHANDCGVVADRSHS